ncbi:hypothetical protein OH807_16145 [Kitasatospora sp. NBC_01560]|uniref:hypothetical protein n=1 Tax=Kitasatospora sp. NBC_01560 TaxID=2975965 RepID=UPI00386E3631
MDRCSDGGIGSAAAAGGEGGRGGQGGGRDAGAGGGADAEVTFEKVTVLSFRPAGPAPVARRGPAAHVGEPADPTRILVRIAREGMTVKRVPGYWVRWAEECGPGDTRYHARWIADEEYVRPDEGSVGDALSVKVAAYWSCDVGGRSRVRTSECVVDFGPGETVQELVLERPDPQRPATLAVHLADAWWADRPGGQEICFGFAGAVEAEGGGEGEWIERSPECVTGILRAAGHP